MDKLFLIDNHIHGAYGINFNYADYNEIKYLLSELFKQGIAGICPTLVGESDKKIKRQLELFKKIKQEQLDVPQEESFIIGVHLEGTFLSPKRPGIQDIANFKKPNVQNFENLVQEFKDIVKIVTIAPEEDENLIDYLNNENIITQAGHSIGNDIKNCIGTTHHFNAMNPIHHRNPSIALSGLIKDEIYTEIIADTVHLSKDMLNLVFRIKPKDKIILISDSIPCAKSNKDIIFCGKKINPSGLDDNGILGGSNKLLSDICINLIENNLLNYEEIKQMAFYNQIKYLKLQAKEITRLNYFK